MKILKQKKYWLEHYHDKKYEDIRNKILNSFNDLIFEEGPHKYYLHGKEITCVSNVTHMFKPPFDEKPMAQATFERNFDNPNSKYYQMTPEMILEEWHNISKNACEHGTERHLFAECIQYFMVGEYDKIAPEFKDRLQYDETTNEPIFIALEPKEEAAAQFYEDMPECIIPILAETKVYREDLGYSGTFDLLCYYDAELDNKKPEKDGLMVLDWKGLPLDTKIITTNGWKTIGELTCDDVVFDKNGVETKILHLSEIHHNDCYKITFDNGDTIVADKDHRWEIFTQASKNKDKKYCVKTTEELYNDLLTINRKSTYKIPKIDVSKGVYASNNYDKELLIDPYVLGVWLGDGHSSCEAITNTCDEIFNEIERRGYKVGEDVSKGGVGKAKTKTIFGLMTKLKKYGLINNKHIPIEYLTASYEVKKQILQGYMDTNGYYNKKRKRIVLSTTRLYQVSFIRQLLSSMGIRSTILSYNKKLNGKLIKCYNVCFTPRFNPFLIRNIEVKEPKNVKDTFFVIRKIEKVDTVPTKCLEVDSDTHTFLYGENMMVTHNTNKDLFKNFKEEKLLPPFEELLDMPLSIYKLQLSLYQLAVEHIGLKVIARRIMWLKPNGTYEKIPLESYTKTLEDYLSTHKIKNHH